MSSKKKKIIIISGATGSGKSSLALKLAQKYNGYLISADSRQVYKEMDIGTNKDHGVWQDDKYLVDGVPEYQVDIINPNQEYSLVDWLQQTEKIISEQQNLGIVVGGTGLYVSALAHGYDLPGEKNDKMRQKVIKLYDKKGPEYLIKKIKKIDPEIEEKIDINNPRRVMRAYEICLQTKKPFAPQQIESKFEVLHLAKKINREELYEKINKRVDEMAQEGLVAEVSALLEKYGADLPAMTGIGYRQIVSYLKGEITLDEALELVKRDTRRYAKRQMTWYKKDKTIIWVDGFEQADKLVQDFLSKSI